jgi:hypothetical protein
MGQQTPGTEAFLDWWLLVDQALLVKVRAGGNCKDISD